MTKNKEQRGQEVMEEKGCYGQPQEDRIGSFGHMERSHQGHIRGHSASLVGTRSTCIVEMMQYKDTQRSIVPLAGTGGNDDKPAVYYVCYSYSLYRTQPGALT